LRLHTADNLLMQQVVLVIDDDQKTREFVADILEAFDFKVIQAESSEEGLTLARLDRPDVILCDVILPDALGFETARALSRHPSTNKVPIILMTGYSYMQRFGSNPNWKLLLKPFSMTTMVEAIKESLKLALRPT
jgi:CRP/FNR family transcriptional regulator, polysaccharide utilization system transcription regulator